MSPKICVVIANYYPEISDKLIDGSNKELKKYGIKINNKIHVPGIFEIPVVIAKKIDKYDGFIALGCVIKGKTPHYNLISKATTNALMKLSITYKKPIGNGVIICLNKKQAMERADKNKANKGGEAARAVLSVLEIIKL